jgi:uncharacterized membrane protein YbhN (UPF0104 family)/tRNA A-37 threonylcarbamoyl transferase component Bud32
MTTHAARPPDRAPAPPGQAGVGIQDTPKRTVRNPSDLVGVIGCALGIVVICLLVVYAHNTTEGVAADVRGFAVLLQRILFVPVAVLELIVILFPPIAVGVDLLVRRQPLAALHALISAIGGIVAAAVLGLGLRQLGPASLVAGLSVRSGTVDVLTIPAYICAITALLTAVSVPAGRRSVTWSWNLMWISVVVAVVTTTASLPGMGIALVAGRLVGCATRYGLGVASQRAYDMTLVEGIRRAGFSPVSLDRVSGLPAEALGQPGTQRPQFFPDHRLYVMTTVYGTTYNVIVLDGDRVVVSIVTRIWRYLRSRGVEGRTALSLRQAGERTALLSYVARSAGVNTPAVLALAEADNSMLIVRQATAASVSFADIDPEQVGDQVLDAMWAQVRLAHRCGIVHRALTPQCFRLVHPDQAAPEVWLLGWETGEVAASELARRIDLTQTLAVMTTKIGSDRALRSAARALNEEELAALGPLLQVPAVPKPTRDLMGNAKRVLAELRTDLARDRPDAVIEPAQITRVGVRTIVMTVLVTVVLIVVLTSFNIPHVVEALRASDWRYVVGAFLVGLVGFAGAGLAMVAFSPVKLSYWRVCLVQVAAAFAALAAPAGLGTAAVNLRLLTKKNVAVPVAAATVALNQVANMVVVALSLIVLTTVTGSNQTTFFDVTPGMLIAVLVVAALVGAVLLVPKARGWVLGNVILVGSYVAALHFAVMAFGLDFPFMAAAMVYLVGTTAGAVTPTPGGMGAIEVAESATLISFGVNPGVAASVVLLFRLVTYWIRIPIGWLVYRWTRRLGDL